MSLFMTEIVFIDVLGHVFAKQKYARKYTVSLK